MVVAIFLYSASRISCSHADHVDKCSNETVIHTGNGNHPFAVGYDPTGGIVGQSDKQLLLALMVSKVEVAVK
jgi:hypothetical protein